MSITRKNLKEATEYCQNKRASVQDNFEES